MDNDTIARVLCVNHQVDARQQICGRLAREGFAVLVESPEIFGDGFVESFRPDLLLAGVGDVDPDALASLIVLYPELAIIMLSDGTTADGRLRSLWHLGVADVLFAPYDLDELARSVRFALNQVTATSFGVDDIIIDEAGHLVSRAGHAVDLTHTEFKLLVNLVTNAGIVLSKRQLLNNVWGFDDYDENLVEVYVSALRRKLEQFGPRVIHTVRSVGYVLRGDVWGQRTRLRTPPHAG